MTRIFTTAAIAALLACSAAPGWADENASHVSVALWDAGDNMVMVDNLKISDHADMSHSPMGIMVSRAAVPAGEVTFDVTNTAKDMQHEMVVAQPADVTKGIVYDADAGEVNEDAPGMNLGEVAELDPGTSGSLTLHLKPGSYVLYCNIAGHYASGMWTVLTVN